MKSKPRFAHPHPRAVYLGPFEAPRHEADASPTPVPWDLYADAHVERGVLLLYGRYGDDPEDCGDDPEDCVSTSEHHVRHGGGVLPSYPAPREALRRLDARREAQARRAGHRRGHARRLVASERARLVAKITKHVRGLFPELFDGCVPYGALWRGGDLHGLGLGEQGVLVLMVGAYRVVPWDAVAVEYLWEIESKLPKFRGERPPPPVPDDQHYSGAVGSPRYYWWKRRAEAGFWPNRRLRAMGHELLAEALGVTRAESAALEPLFMKNRPKPG